MVDVFMMSMITERRHCIFVSLLIVILIQMLGTDCDTDEREWEWQGRLWEMDTSTCDLDVRGWFMACEVGLCEVTADIQISWNEFIKTNCSHFCSQNTRLPTSPYPEMDTDVRTEQAHLYIVSTTGWADDHMFICIQFNFDFFLHTSGIILGSVFYSVIRKHTGNQLIAPKLKTYIKTWTGSQSTDWTKLSFQISPLNKAVS